MTVSTSIRRGIGIPVALLLALVLQVVIVNRLPLPGGGVPDLVLLVVTAVGATTGPVTGMLTGFCGGLALDIAPPGGHLAGEYALVFCLAGYACGRVRGYADQMQTGASVTSLVVMAAGAAGGEAAKAVLGRMLSDPDMALPVVKHVLPGAILYDLLLCPFVLWLVAALVRVHEPGYVTEPRQRRARVAPEYGALGLAGAGAVPKLKFGGGPPAAAQQPRRKEPRLNLAGAGSAFTTRTNGGVSSGSLPASARRPASVHFSVASRGGIVGGSALRPGKAAGSGSRQAAPGKGWLRAGKNAGSAAARPKEPGRGWLKVSSPAGLARFSGSALSRPAVPKFRRRSPGRGWLRVGKPVVTPKFRSPGRGWLKAGKPTKPTKPSKRRKGMGGLR